MSLGTASPTLPPNAAQEAGGNIAQIRDATLNTIAVLLQSLLTETKITNSILAEGLSVKADLDQLRNDPTFQ